eukprot:13052146-Alexandrium_andersonii.AAC.1
MFNLRPCYTWPRNGYDFADILARVWPVGLSSFMLQPAWPSSVRGRRLTRNTWAPRNSDMMARPCR